MHTELYALSHMVTVDGIVGSMSGISSHKRGMLCGQQVALSVQRAAFEIP